MGKGAMLASLRHFLLGFAVGLVACGGDVSVNDGGGNVLPVSIGVNGVAATGAPLLAHP